MAVIAPAAKKVERPPRPESGPRAGNSRFRREAKREIRYPLSVACAVVCSWITASVPLRLRLWLADRWGDFFYAVSPGYRRSVTANLQQVLGPDATLESVDGAMREVFRTSARNFADLLMVPRAAPGHFRRSTAVASGSFSLLDDALAIGKGALILSGHIGAFDLMGQVLNERGYKLTVVTTRTTSKFVFDAVCYLRGARGMKLVEASPSGIRSTIQAVKRGELAVFVSDRDFFDSGRMTPFFDRGTRLPPGIVRLARDTGAPIVPIYGERTGLGHQLVIEPGFVVPKTTDLDADIAFGMRHVVASLERAINRRPAQWVMFQQVWPSAPDAQAPAAPDVPPVAAEPSAPGAAAR